jgi:ribonuclease-3
LSFFDQKDLLKTQKIDKARRTELKEFEKIARIRFRDLKFLNLSFCHRSYVNETAALQENNERLEFLGDSILGQVVSLYLFQSLPDRPEGDLAKIKSFVVSEPILSVIASDLEVNRFLLIGKGEEKSGGRQKSAILADCMEAIFGAYFLDAGYEKCRKFILELLVPQIDKVLANKHTKDYKTLLQEWVQKKYKSYPKYILADRVGPDHNRTFFMEVEVQGERLGKGQGKSKKLAKQMAAEEAYLQLTKKKAKSQSKQGDEKTP